MGRVYFLVHGCDAGFLGTTPGGILPPYLDLGYDRAWSQGIWGVVPLDKLIEIAAPYAGFGGVQLSWIHGTWPFDACPAVGTYPVDGWPIACAPRIPKDSPRECLLAGLEGAARKRADLLHAMGKELWDYTGLPHQSASITNAQIDADYALAARMGVDSLELDVAGACRTHVDGRQTSAYHTLSHLADPTSPFRNVSLEPTDVVTPGLRELLDGRFSTVTAGPDWRTRTDGPGWAGRYCPGAFKRHRVILPGSIPTMRRFDEAYQAIAAGCDTVIEAFGVPIEPVIALLQYASGVHPAADTVAPAAPFTPGDDRLARRISGGVPWGAPAISRYGAASA